MNKQILTDIVNSILGLSKKKKKEFVELLDDGINGVSEQLNETVEQINQKINNDEKFIPDTIKNRITALEQAVIALGGTLS